MPCAINLQEGIITHKKMLKENPPKDDKRIRIRIKGQRQKRSGQERQKR
jgi:cytochrome c-type biogenesis protein CcmH/NrfG